SQFVGMPSKGISTYLTGETDNWQSLVKEVENHPGVFVLPIGHRPPNPSELLDNGRIATLLEECRKDYDYVFIDCPPVDIVVDTQILERYVDRTLFVIRAGLLDKHSLVEIDAIYSEKRFKNMSVILNGTDSEHSRNRSYGSYGYYGGE
ncbi:MAG: chromosome partitioning protein ParA, partial [Muribaculaceae bacterium]|nr:chromosome partitioning protein ParA [Muribaculaceae bacterium]